MLKFIMKLIKRKKINPNVITTFFDFTPIKDAESIMEIIKPNQIPEVSSILDAIEKQNNS